MDSRGLPMERVYVADPRPHTHKGGRSTEDDRPAARI